MDVILGYATQRGDDAALIHGERVVTWSELVDRGNQVARALAARGVGPGDRVAVALRNSVEFFEILRGAGVLGAQVVPVSFRARRDEIEYLVSDSEAKVVVAEEANAGEYTGIPGTVLRGEAYEAWVGAHPSEAMEDAPGGNIAVMRNYTSGTTGRPKMIVRAPENRRGSRVGPEAALAIMNLRFEPLQGPDEVHLLAAVMYHTAPGGYASMAMNRGHTIVITDGFDAEEALALIERHRVTWTQMAPIHLVRITALPEEVQRRYDLSSMKRLMHAGAPCPVEVKWKALSLFPEGSVYEYYAATEGYGTECPEQDWRRKPGTVGRPFGGVQIRILDDEGRELAPGEVGLVYIDNGADFEYAGDADKTRETWQGSAFSVGDMGYLDEDGFLFLTDRKSHMIISGGANVYPAEVENVLFAHPAVADVAVVGVPDDEFGEQVKAIVELRTEATADELIAFCRDRLAGYKCPRSVDFIDEMPRDPNGKIRKKTLRDPYWADRERHI